jgi:hypothetical protein
MSVEEDARQARANALGALDGVQEAKQRILERLDGLEATMVDLIRGAVLYEAVKLVSKDMHQVSNRPCPTCQAVTNALGEPFGCYAYQAKRVKP